MFVTQFRYFLLPTEDCYSVSSTYREKMTCTRSGVPCQRWDVTAHRALERPSDPDDLASNCCWDPDDSGTPWSDKHMQKSIS
jgi:hypothetical protein